MATTFKASLTTPKGQSSDPAEAHKQALLLVESVTGERDEGWVRTVANVLAAYGVARVTKKRGKVPPKDMHAPRKVGSSSAGWALWVNPG